MIKLSKYTWLLLLGLCFCLLSCEQEEPTQFLTPERQLELDISIIQEFLQENGLVAERTASGLHYIIDEQGTGGNPTATSDVDVTYKGYLTDDSVFDPGSRTSFNLSRVIPGWTEGIQLFEKGGKGMLLIPSYLGYSNRPPTSAIPRNAVLLFDIELHDFL